MKEFFEQFKAFALRGNVVDMAVGVIIGGAFGKIVTSVVNDLVMPPIGVLIGGVDFSDLFINLGSKKVATLAEAQAAKMPVIAYGKFITNLIDFIVMAFVILPGHLDEQTEKRSSPGSTYPLPLLQAARGSRSYPLPSLHQCDCQRR